MGLRFRHKEQEVKISRTLKQLKKLITKNSPVILTGIAVVGTGTSAYLAARGGLKSFPALEIAETEKGSELTKKEKFITTWKFYAPAVIGVVATSTCMILATKIGLERTAALAGALALVDRNNSEYREKVKELLGQNKDTKIKDEIAKDHIAAANIDPSQFTLEPGQQIFWDMWSGRPFVSTNEKLDATINRLNHEMIYGGYCDLTTYYKEIGLERTQQSNDLGWSSQQLIEIAKTPVMVKDHAVVAVQFDKDPMLGFQEYSFCE